MNIQKYLAFIKTVEYGSFTKAAEVLGYTQSGISHMIHDLENDWNLKLLERDRGGVRISSDGLRLLPHAKKICEANVQLFSEIDALHGLQSGLIRIGTFSSVATHWLPNIIKAFQKEYPNIEYELLLGDYTEIETWILEGRVDFGFLRLPAHTNLTTVFSEKDHLLVVLPENHPLSQLERFPLAQLKTEPFILMEKGMKAEISEIFTQHKITPNIRFTTWDDYAIMSMVESGLGISILPELILQRIPYKLTIKELEVPAHREIGLCLKSMDTISLATKKFLEYLPHRNHL